MTVFISGGNGVSVSSTETTINIPKEVMSIQFSNRGTTACIISLGGNGRFSINLNSSETKSIDLADIRQLYGLLGVRWDMGGDGFGGAFTHRTASGTTTIDFEYIAVAV